QGVPRSEDRHPPDRVARDRSQAHPVAEHRDWRRAKRQADEAAAGFAVHEPNGKPEAAPEPLTLGTLFDIFIVDRS
ncbi:MAG: hypothetical protein OXI12_04425, partial [Gammaproteobacteria bacterium]|nr:hypothetical protein [Gammaproteobacteria bacterium]